MVAKSPCCHGLESLDWLMRKGRRGLGHVDGGIDEDVLDRSSEVVG